MVRITALNIYPVKSCRGIALERARVEQTGFAHDREWMVVGPDGHLITQREEPRLALIETALTEDALQLCAPTAGALQVPLNGSGEPVEVTCWRDRCAAFDAGAAASTWLERFLGRPARLVRFDARHKRRSDPHWTGGLEAFAQFSDAFAWLLISQASLSDLNGRLPRALPMNRFRPNIVVDGLPAYGEDRVHEYRAGTLRMRTAKPCTRCAIPTTDQLTGKRDGEEPLRTLKQYRFNRELKGVMFGQNLILVGEPGETLWVGRPLDVTWKDQKAEA